MDELVITPQTSEVLETSEVLNGFKETEIGPIPVDWEVVPLSSLARVKYGKAKPKREGSIPTVGSGGTYAWVNEALVDFPTLVIGRKGTAGRAWLMDKPCWPSDTTFYLEWTQEVDIHFLFGYLTLNPLSGEHAKTTLPSLSRPDLENYLVPFPPLPEQRRIAHVLSTIQRAIAAQDDLIAAAREVKRSLMQRLFTYGPGPEPAATQETEIGEIPEHWEVMRLGNLVEIASGQVDPRELPYLKMIHIGPEDVEEGTGRILTPKTAEELGLKSGKYLFTPEDVVYSKIRPYLRKVALPSFNGICSADMYPLRPKGKMGDRCFLYYVLLSDIFTKQAVSHQQRTGIPKINRTQLKSVGIPLPNDIEEQKKIADILDATVKKIEAELNRKAALQELFKSMLHQLMTGQIRLKERGTLR